MNKPELVSTLKQNYDSFIGFINSISDETYGYSSHEKWTAGQHLDHLVLSVKATAYVFNLGKISIAEKFGTGNTKRSYNTLKKLYIKKLKGGGKAPERFVPDAKVIHQKTSASQDLTKQIEALSIALDHFSEKELDTLCVPHPLLGNLSLRELLYNAIYHAEHHQNLIAKMLNI